MKKMTWEELLEKKDVPLMLSVLLFKQVVL